MGCSARSRSPHSEWYCWSQGFLLADWLTPGQLARLIWVERNRNAAVYVSSAVLGVGIIVFTSIATRYTGIVDGLISTAVFGALGLLLMAGAFWLVDVLTPGRLGALLVDPEPHPAVWVSGAANLAIALLGAASIT